MEVTYPKTLSVLYAGKRLNGREELYELFFIIDDKDNITSEKLMFGKLKPTFSVGCVYDIIQNNENSFSFTKDNKWSGVKYRYEKQKDLITEYSLLHKAAIESVSINNRIKKMTSENPAIENLLKPLKAVYNNLSMIEKQTLLAYIIQILTR